MLVGRESQSIAVFGEGLEEEVAFEHRVSEIRISG